MRRRDPRTYAEQLEAAFAFIEATAAAGERAPLRDFMETHITTALALAGRIRVEVFARNWRVITVLVGPHAGKQTQPPPTRGKPYYIIDRNGSRSLSAHHIGRALPVHAPVRFHSKIAP